MGSQRHGDILKTSLGPNTDCRVSGVPPGRECSEKLRRVGSNGCKAVLTGNRGEYLRVVGIHSDG